ncbi:carbon catabolite repressor protein 4 homolog 4 isoform X2 [Cryptomeria japonica]|nr:carbon catabolite repressor protein 4 homolog 4 isoform X2 [Cryptomeria japonica]
MSGTVSSYLPEFVSVDDKIWAVKNISEGSIIRIASYNILAQAYIRSTLFPHSPAHCLKWKARSQSVLALLKSLEADFLCLQELDEFETFYKGNMDKHGYSSVYIQRSGRKRDGCGIFYKRERAELLLEEVIQYNDLVPVDEVPAESYEVEEKETSNPENCRDSSPTKTSGSQQTNLLDDRGDPDDPKVRLKRDCVGLLTAFKLLEPPHHVIVVANTHIYWDPEWVDVKLAQVKYLLLQLANFKDTISTKFDCRPLVFVTGDFNSTPGDEVYQYLISGISQYDNGYSYKTNTKEASSGSPIALHSLYAYIGGEPPFTNYTPGFTGTLDYILFSSPNHVQPIRVLKLPSDESPDIQGGLPNENHPSDHLPIGADFEIH